ncbi:hypothetical protein MBSD_n2047 [Mizugakiibacter sediminis]|uniref:DUF3619 family protein n=1 Tax=Mizugakiibacter sediminis TaxID=1475481 RepID=A0A0K8QQS1_9GAMM|nr:hypothetical protein [Mizugakiibacter sediminis]GAP66732.1 hypothetical protein MBSD_n2047 [Mizugakiibacter sediminis]
MNMHADDPEKRYRHLFDRACAGLDAATAARLRGARVRALQARHPRAAVRLLIPAGALAAALLAVGVVWQRAAPPARTPAPAHAVALDGDGDVLLEADAEQIDMARDLDFYAWLADQPQEQQR